MHARLRTAILPEGVAEDLHVGEHPVAAALDPVELAQRAAGDPPREAAPLDTPSFVVAPAPHRVLVHQLVDRAGLPVDGVTALLALLQLRRVVQHLLVFLVQLPEPRLLLFFRDWAITVT